MTIPEFRKNLKAYFDKADSGEAVTITRAGKVYTLTKIAD
jgi:antitoxin (DNA-binding transcriptional repressor) of toxin-antitoxin stability system